MAKTLVGALALASLPSALAFRNTSPFFLVSTADLNFTEHDIEIAKSSDIVAHLTTALKDCPSKSYFIVRQDGVSFADYQVSTTTHPGGFLHSTASDVKTTIEIPEVIGSVDIDSVSAYLQKACGAIPVKLPNMLDGRGDKDQHPPQEQLADGVPQYVYDLLLERPVSDLDTSNTLINTLVSRYSTHEKYTVIYTTSPKTKEQGEAAERTYEMETPFGEAVQMELKRDLSSHQRATKAQKQGGLFERYQYFSPGLFMGISAVIPLLLILVVGLKALAGLEVSYFAFSKEMGPAAQRKQ